MPATKRTIAVLTTSRADFSHLCWPLRAIAKHPELEPRLIVAAAHLSPEFGLTVGEIEREGFSIHETVECLLSSDTDVGMAKTIGVATLGLADVLGRMRPDMLLLIADRYEMLAPAAVALALRVPIAHIEGGEVTEGAIDDAVRNALTKLSHLHFTPTDAARRRVVAMGEEAWRVHCVGAPSLDHVSHSELHSRQALERRLGISLEERFFLVACHPVTLRPDPLEEPAAVLRALGAVEEQLIFCFPNADAHSRLLIEDIRQFCQTDDRARLFVNLHPVDYWSLLALATLVVGNSSSIIMESPALRVPAVNVGSRQEGRQRAGNIIDAPADPEAIRRALEKAADPSFRASLAGLHNPYGDGRAGERIATVLAEAPLGERLLCKRALPLGEEEGRLAFVQT
ncbi:MAG: UDP-N-acetylglucosamine 2-epimerase (hydrolyzing) [Luteitalea sp.]|nr:UDP-N-acetylglucosamine 2-epimerase (hydrolyzing) [Luteitalea sp.]